MASQNIARLGVVLAMDTAEFTASVDKAISENAKLKNAIRRDTNAAAGELINLINATNDYGKALSKVELIQREVTSGRFMNATQDMKDRLLAQAAAYDKVASSQKKVTDGLTQQQKMALTYQTTDLFTQLASGQNPMIAIIQQGGQLKDQMGGIGGMFRALGTLITPFNVALAGTAAAIGAIGFAAYQADKELDKFKDTMALSGNYTKLSYEQYKDLATVLGDRVGVGSGKAKDAILALVQTGQYTEKTIGAVSQAVLTYSKIAGVDANVAAQKLASGLNGTASGASALNKEMNFLTLEQYKQIDALERAGKKQDAIQIATIALNTKLQQQARDLGVLEGAWSKVTKAMSDYWDKFKSLVSGPTQSDTLSALDKQISDIEQKLNGTEEDTVFARGWRKVLQTLKDSKENLLEIQRLQGRSTAAKDLTGEKEKIGWQEKYGDMQKQVNIDLQKSIQDARIAQLKIGANEEEKISLDAAEKILDARSKMEDKNRQQDGQFYLQNLKIYENQAAIIVADSEEKKRQIRMKAQINLHNAMIQYVDDQRAGQDAWDKQAAAADVSAKQRTQQMIDDQALLQLRKDMVYATDKEVQLSAIGLKYDQMRRDARYKPGEESVIQQLNQQENIEKMNLSIQDSLLKSQKVFDSVYGAMSNAIDSFVKGGKTKFKDFAQSIIRDMIAIQLKAQMLTVMRGLFSGMFGKVGIGNMGITPPTGQGFGMLGFADGGDPPVNQVSMVGERGPELFIPRTAGTIVPHDKLQNFGSTTNITNNYIDAIDTKSFEQRLLGSSNTIWAANKYGEKTLATNYGRT